MRGCFLLNWVTMALGITDFIGPVIVPIAVAVAFALFRKYLPSRTTTSQSPAISPTEPQELEDLKWVVGCAMLGVGVAFAIGSYRALLFANHFFANAEGRARFQFLPTTAIWWFFPGLGAAALAWEITFILWSSFGDPKRARRYAQWSNSKTGFNATAVLLWMALLIALPIGIATILAVPMHVSLRENDIVIRGYGFRPARHYPYSDARRLAVVHGFRTREGKFESRAQIMVQFSDGYCWHSGDNQDFTASVDPELLAFLQQKTGLSRQEAETEADLNFPGKPRGP